jgi:hypothetical protein
MRAVSITCRSGVGRNHAYYSTGGDHGLNQGKRQKVKAKSAGCAFLPFAFYLLPLGASPPAVGQIDQNTVDSGDLLKPKQVTPALS